MGKQNEIKEVVTIRFAGDSGDGMQLTGSQFTNTTALVGNDLSTFPDFPAEIRAPAGTVPGVSGFQIQFGSKAIYTPGDKCDVLVAMNAAALKANLKHLKEAGIIIANISGFDKRNLSLSKYDDANPLEDGSLTNYQVIEVDVTKLTKESLADNDVTPKDAERCKNMFVLGILYWMYNRPLEPTINFLRNKFGKKSPEIAEANIKALQDGHRYGEATEIFTVRYEVKQAKIETGTYRNVTGNDATVLGLAAAAKKSGLRVFYGSYPITPASDILHGLSKLKNYGVMTYQAEDEIAAVSSAIGASFGGSLGVTGSSGPGIALKTEAIGLAAMLELPLVIMNIQRGGPSTGLPTKTEQADLLQAMYGRNGECPIAIVAASSPSDCFHMIFEACRISIEHMIPVMFMSDGYLGNGSEPWKFPTSNDLKEIKVAFEPARVEENAEKFLPYVRDEALVRPWAVPGTKGLEHRVGGLEKFNETGNISYDPENHQYMVKLREKKRDLIAEDIPLQEVDNGNDHGKLLILSWGSTYGTIKTAVHEARIDGLDVSHAHLKYLSPFPKNLEYLLKGFDKVLIPEINNGQLVKLIRDKFLIPAEGFNKIKGLPFTVGEVKEKITEVLQTS